MRSGCDSENRWRYHWPGVPSPLTVRVHVVPAKLLPALFPGGRTGGWGAKFLEHTRLGRLVRPSAIYVGPAPRSPEAVEGWDEIARG